MIFQKKLWLAVIVILFCLFSSDNVSAQKYTLSGYVRDAFSGEELINSTIYVKELKTGAITNVYGFYSLTLPKGEYNISYSYMGYQAVSAIINLSADLKKNVELASSTIQTSEVEIVGKRKDANIKSTDVGKVDIDIEKAKSIPAVLGEVDILKTLQLLPGVKSAGEGSSGFYVRGGGADQNLILLDEALVFNTGHLFGFFSVFNSDAIKNMSLIKGGMPANYGGRLASVVDITMKEGNNKSYHADGGIGLISSRLTIEGPIVKDKCSFMLSGRRTYIDILLQPFTKDSEFSGSGYYFYDLNTKINYRFSDRDRLFLSGYFGRDVFTFKSPGGGKFNASIPWGNATVTLRWNHLFSDHLFMNASAIYNDYHFELGMSSDNFSMSTYSGIKDQNLKLDFSYFPNNVHKIKFGGNYIYHTFIPGATSGSTSTGIKISTDNLKRKYADEYAVYVLDEFDLNEHIKINAGLRFSAFTLRAPYDQLTKDAFGNPVDTINYISGQPVQTYYGLEPRLNVRYELDKNSSIKASYNYNNQYIHLVSNSSSTLPTDIWVPSSKVVKPQKGYEVSLGYFRNLFDNLIETSVEVYYKKMDNQIEYKDGYTQQIGRDLEWDFVFGEGQSYGIEFFINKSLGKLTGWIGYTYSSTTRHFPDLYTVDFPSKYDLTHDLSIVLLYQLTKRLSVSGTFVYSTGQATTIPLRKYWMEGQIATENSPRNSYRLEPYHRADVGLTLKGREVKKKTGKKKKLQSDLVISVYNVYDHKNVYFIYTETTGDYLAGDLKLQAKKVSLFPIIPSISWNFRF
jgi:hypothetical protein